MFISGCIKHSTEKTVIPPENDGSNKADSTANNRIKKKTRKGSNRKNLPILTKIRVLRDEELCRFF
jgi:hypothetical protein